MKQRYVYVLAALLTVIGLSIFVYKWRSLGFPLTEDQEPPVAPAGYHEADGEKPVRGNNGAVPTASEAIMSTHTAGGGKDGGEG